MSDQPSPKRKTLGLKSAASAGTGAARKSGATRPVRVSDLNRRRVQTVAEGVRAAQQRAEAGGKPRKEGGGRPAPQAGGLRRPGGDERGPRRAGGEERGPRRFGDEARERPARWGERSERTERPQRFERGERTERPQRFERGERTERPQRFERGERTERPQRFERGERTERGAGPRREFGADRSGPGARPGAGPRREFGADHGERAQRGRPGERGERPPRFAAAESRDRPRRPQAQAGELRPARSGFGAGAGRAPKPGSDRVRDDARRPAPARSPARPPSNAHAAGAAHEPDGLVRLSKRMSELGLCSRREADEWIPRGWVLVDGKPVTELGTRIRPDATIEIHQAARSEQGERVTVLLHKPVGYVSGQAEEGYQPAAVLFTAENQWENDPTRKRYAPWQHKGLAPAGRLDIDSTGLLVLTQDGRIARQLIGEDSNIEKEYLVRVVWEDAPDGPVERNVSAVFPAERLDKLRHGLSLDGEPLKPAKVSWQNEEQLRFVLREGKKRQIRRMCEQVGLKVVGLKRVRMGRIVLGDLPVGQWRFLGPFEKF
ncbi:pseudouridine synthase [Cupriavidus gilardii]|uniref:pseudouridine synthase n=1 Tax=Cupriavidus gilardii TaxID=82541 RepID=UPI0021C0B670|nr:pseudouridine synthase [Cupriavidus gilardii]MCT9118355.1 pseudouridine synthase [Cupriavidus gilardii]